MSVFAAGGTMPAGVLLPEAVLNSPWFAVLAGFVAVNTVVYVCLAVFKMLPPPRWIASVT